MAGDQIGVKVKHTYSTYSTRNKKAARGFAQSRERPNVPGANH
jgi:hypothetical protein